MSCKFSSGSKAPGAPAGGGGFTLVEMLVALAIMAVLVALLFPALAGTTESGRRAKCLGNLRQIGAATFAFAADNNGELPSQSSPTWMSQIWSYACPGREEPKTMPSNKMPPEFAGSIFCCPAAVKDDPRVRDYAFNYRIGDGDVDTRDRIVTLSRASQHALVADAISASVLNVSNLKARHGDNKANVLYVDGHAQTTELTEEILQNYNGVFWGRQSQAFRW